MDLLLGEVLQVLLQDGFRRPQIPDEDLGTRKTNLQQPDRRVAEEAGKLKVKAAVVSRCQHLLYLQDS